MTPSARFALQIVQTLQQAGFEALWAGGCVRDQLLGKTPKDYDVATSATPDQVRHVFGRRRTLMIGAAFGVVAVLGPKRSRDATLETDSAEDAETGTYEQVEVATFRREEGYSDGRHPDHVAFSTAEHDAQRRDFTINGLFFDPIQAAIIDYVGGRIDLDAKLIRCIGDPSERFGEDKLRMLRAIRFSTGLGFEIEADTYAAVARHADEVAAVSAERIATEMRKILTLPRAATGLADLQSTGLIRVVLPEYSPPPNSTLLPKAINLLGQLSQTNQIDASRFTTRLAATLWPLTFGQSVEIQSVENRAVEMLATRQRIATLAARWKLTNRERDDANWLLQHLTTVLRAHETDWPDLQPVLVDSRASALVQLASAIATCDSAYADGLAGIKHCQNKLSLPATQLDPLPLVNGHELISAGVAAGRQLGATLDHVRRLQLLGELKTKEEAIQWATKAGSRTRQA